MKKYLLIFVLIYFFPLGLFSQIFKAEDGTKIKIEVISNDPDEGRNAAIYIGAWSPDGARLLGFEYLKPTKYYFNLDAGLGASGNFTYFLKSWKNERIIYQSLKIEGNTRYKAKIDVPRRKSLGLNVGGGHTIEYFELQLASSYVSIGASLLTSFHINLKTENGLKKAQGTGISRMNFDVVYYINPQFINENIASRSILEDETRKVGCRFYLDGKRTIWSPNGRISLHYKIGVGIQVVQKQLLTAIGGFGLGYSFG